MAQIRLIGGMKEVAAYGVVLRPMAAGDLERVRRWRNAPHVRKRMAYTDYISPAMQVRWWGQLDPEANRYYLVGYHGAEIGVVHAKDIDWEAGTAETGIFIGRREYLGTFAPVLAVLALMDELFLVQSLGRLRAKVRADAHDVLAFNRRLGYRVVAEEGDMRHLEVDAATYLSAAAPLRAMALRLGEGRG